MHLSNSRSYSSRDLAWIKKSIMKNLGINLNINGFNLERERVVFIFWEQTKNNPPLQSLATTTLDKNFVLMATFTLSLTENRQRTMADLNTLDSHKSNQQI